MSFLRHGEIYPYDGGCLRKPNLTEQGRGSTQATAPFHRGDEFPTGYSLAGCAPAEPASASPVNGSIGGPVERDNRLAVNGNLSRLSVSQGGGPLQNAPHFTGL